MLGCELKRWAKLAGRRVAARFVENAADDLDELELEEVEVKQVVGIEDLECPVSIAEERFGKREIGMSVVGVRLRTEV